MEFRITVRTGSHKSSTLMFLRRAITVRREHHVVQHDHGNGPTARQIFHDHSHHGNRRKPRQEENGPGIRGDLSSYGWAVQWFARFDGFDRGSAHVLPGSQSRADSRTSADASRKGFLSALWTQSLRSVKSGKSHWRTVPFSREPFSTRSASWNHER